MYTLFCCIIFDIFKEDNQDGNNMAGAHLPEELKDLVNTSKGSYDDTKMIFVQANGTPENKVCILIVDDNL